MKFTTPCFVRVEDVDKRKELTEWLKGIGYHVCSCCLFDGCNTLHCRGIDRLKIAYEVHGICDYDEETRYSIDQFKAENVAKGHPAIDCGENIELFKALAAMTDDRDDVNQWYVFAADYYFGEEDVYYHRGHVISGIDMIYVFEDWRNALYYCRKATVDEIIKHFKKS